jgi:hypothetical protein
VLLPSHDRAGEIVHTLKPGHGFHQVTIGDDRFDDRIDVVEGDGFGADQFQAVVTQGVDERRSKTPYRPRSSTPSIGWTAPGTAGIVIALTHADWLGLLDFMDSR